MDKQHKPEAIVMHSVSRWDQPLSSASFSLAKEFSKERKTFYVDHPFTLKDLVKGFFAPNIKRRWKPLFLGLGFQYAIDAKYPNLFAVTPLVALPINWMPKGKLFTVFSKLNNAVFQYTIKKVLKKNKLSSYVYFNSYNPFYGFDLRLEPKPQVYVYQSRDNIANSNYVKKHGPELERYIAKQADIKIATSTDLTEILSQGKVKFTCFPNGADTALFKTARYAPENRPSEIPQGKPIIGYIGNIGLRMDFLLLQKVIERFSHCHIVLVGPEQIAKYSDVDFAKYKNVTFVGPKNLNDLPAYLHYMDCTLMPFKCNALTRSIYPLKINEYLAAGKPVVSTNFSPDLDQFASVVALSPDHDSFLENIKKELESDSEEKKDNRVKMTTENSWKARVEEFWNLINHNKGQL